MLYRDGLGLTQGKAFAPDAEIGDEDLEDDVGDGP
jgi:hypothetical protein